MTEIDGETPIRKVKEWPEGHELADFRDLVEPLREALGAAYDLSASEIGPEGLPYDGYNIGRKGRGQIFSPDEELSAERLIESERDQGRDPATVILSIAVQLGIEQGRRMELEDVERKVELIERMSQILDIRALLLDARAGSKESS